MAKTPVVISLSGRLTSMPTRKLFPNEMMLHKSSRSPAMQNITPTHEIVSEWKNSLVPTVGRSNAAANMI